jgi:hypothetical protein
MQEFAVSVTVLLLFVTFLPIRFCYKNVTKLFTALCCLTEDDPKKTSKGPKESILEGGNGLLPLSVHPLPDSLLVYEELTNLDLYSLRGVHDV